MRSSSLKVNYLINIGGALVPLAISLLTVPIYLTTIGTARYGMLSIIWVLLGYFGFLDLGLSHASANALARIDISRKDDRMRVLATALSINMAMGLIGSGVLALFGYVLLEHLLKVPAAILPEIVTAFPWIAALLPLAMANGVAIGSLESRDEFLAANILQLSASLGGQIPPVIAAILVSPSLAVVVPVAVASRGLAVMATLAYVFRLERGPAPPRFDRATARSLLSYGGWVSVSGIISPLLATLDQIVVGSVLNVARVTYYSVPMTFVTRSQIVAVALMRTLFPALSRAEPEAARELAGRAASTLAYGYGALCVPAIFVAPIFFSLWLGSSFAAQASPVAAILLMGVWVNGLAMVPFNLLQAQGRPHLTAIFHAAEAVPFVGLLLLLTSRFGLVGAAVGWTLRVMVDAVLLYRAARIDPHRLRRIAPGLLVMAVSVALSLSLSLNWPAMLGLAALGGIAMLVLAMLLDPLSATLALRMRYLLRRRLTRRVA